MVGRVFWSAVGILCVVGAFVRSLDAISLAAAMNGLAALFGLGVLVETAEGFGEKASWRARGRLFVAASLWPGLPAVVLALAGVHAALAPQSDVRGGWGGLALFALCLLVGNALRSRYERSMARDPDRALGEVFD